MTFKNNTIYPSINKQGGPGPIATDSDTPNPRKPNFDAQYADSPLEPSHPIADAGHDVCHLLKDVAALIDFHAIVAVSWIGFMLSAVYSLGARAALFYTELARTLPKKLKIFRGAI